MLGFLLAAIGIGHDFPGEFDMSAPMRVAFAALDADNGGTLDGTEIKRFALDLWSVIQQAAHHIFVQAREICVPSKLFTEALAIASSKASDSGAELEAKLLGPFAGGAAVSAADLLAAYRAYRTVYRTEDATVAALSAACKDTVAPGPMLLLIVHAMIMQDEKNRDGTHKAMAQWQDECDPVAVALLEFYDTFGTMIKAGGFLSLNRKQFGDTLKPILLNELEKVANALKGPNVEVYGEDYVKFWDALIDDAKHLTQGSVVDAFIDLARQHDHGAPQRLPRLLRSRR